MSGAERLLRDTVEIIRTTPATVARGPYNEEIADPAKTEIVRTRGYLTTESSRDLGLEPGDQVHTVSEWRILLPANTPIGAGDRVAHDGRLFEVVGEVHEARAPVGATVRFLVASLERVNEALAVPRGGV